MASIRINKFTGLVPGVGARLLGKAGAEIAHNCLLWDGSIRALRSWINVPISGEGNYIYIDKNNQIRKTEFSEPIEVKTPANYVIALSGDKKPIRMFGGVSYYAGVYTPDIDSASVDYTRGYFSNKPVNRLYALSAILQTPIGVEEGPITLIPNQTPQGIIYEGDIVDLQITIDPGLNDQTGYRLYRSISGLDTGKDVTNNLDTEWYLINEFTNLSDVSIRYIDGGSATTDPLDLYLADRFYPPAYINYEYLGMAEAGWVCLATIEGILAFSEKFLSHAYPTENYYTIGEKITDMVVNDNNVYLGTESIPYIASLSDGEALGLQVGVTPYKGNYRCLPNTMCKTPAGAMYTTINGLVELSREGQRLLSASIGEGFNSFYSTTYPDQAKVSIRYKDVQAGAYHLGVYYGFCRFPFDQYGGAGIGFKFNTNNSIDGPKQGDTFTTFDFPFGNVTSYISCDRGLHICVEGTPSLIYRLPLPSDNSPVPYESWPKLCYQWRSGKIVLGGKKVMAAAKVVHDCKGWVRLVVYADCCCVYNSIVNTCEPFSLPPDIVGTEFQVEVNGTSTVHEIHIASSMQELTSE